MTRPKMLMITENTIIKLYEQFVWEEHDDIAIAVMIVDHIKDKLTNAKKKHPLTDLYTNADDPGPFYELVHFIFSTVENYVKTRPNFSKKK